MPCPYATGATTPFVRLCGGRRRKRKTRPGRRRTMCRRTSRFRKSDRRDLRRREKRQRDTEDRGDQAADSGEQQRRLAVAAAHEIIGGGKFQQCSKHVNKWDKLEDDCERQEFLKCFLHTGAAGEIDDRRESSRRRRGRSVRRTAWRIWDELCRAMPAYRNRGPQRRGCGPSRRAMRSRFLRSRN